MKRILALVAMIAAGPAGAEDCAKCVFDWGSQQGNIPLTDEGSAQSIPGKDYPVGRVVTPPFNRAYLNTTVTGALRDGEGVQSIVGTWGCLIQPNGEKTGNCDSTITCGDWVLVTLPSGDKLCAREFRAPTTK